MGVFVDLHRCTLFAFVCGSCQRARGGRGGGEGDGHGAGAVVVDAEPFKDVLDVLRRVQGWAKERTLGELAPTPTARKAAIRLRQRPRRRRCDQPLP